MSRVSSALIVSMLALGVLVAAQAGPPAPGAAQAPQPPVTFRLEVNYVEVDAIVTDAQGRPVPGLTIDDFDVLEDRQPQKLTAFSHVDIPVERADRPLFASMPIEPDVQTNTGREGRLYLLLLDTLHTSPVSAIKVKAAARRFIERNLGTNDVAAVVFTGGNAKDTQDFTNNRRLLLAAIDKFQGARLPGQTEALTQELQARPGRLPGAPLSDPGEFERAYNARSAMDRIRTLANFLAGVRGRRKAMLLFGEGVDYDIANVLGNTQANGVLESVRDAIGAATRANVAIYAIDPRGLTNPEQDLVFSNQNPGADDRSLGDLGSASIRREFQISQDSLRQLGNETGGFAVLNQNDFTNAFERIVADNSSYYVLGYYSTNERRDGRYRTITVRVKRPGLMVRARRGYVAARGGRTGDAPAAAAPGNLAASTNEALSSPLPVPGIPMQVAAWPFRGEAPNAAVALALEMGIQGWGFTQTDGTYNNKVELAYTATDAEARQRGSATHTMTFTLRPETFARAQGRGVRVVSQIDLPPGRYQLRIAAAEAGGKNGSVIADLEVPDFSREPLTMSGLAVSSSSASQTTTVRPRDPLAQFLPGPPTTRRDFTSDEQLALFTEFYENIKNAPAHKLDIITTVRTDDGRVVFRDEEQRDSTELQGSSGGYGYQTVLSLRDYAPGIYVVRVEGHSRATQADAAIGRDLQIRIVSR